MSKTVGTRARGRLGAWAMACAIFLLLQLGLSQPAAALFFQQGPKLVGTGVLGSGAYQGSSVALSADGTTAIVGGNSDNSGAGAVWIYTLRANGKWHQDAKLVGTGATGVAWQGWSVAISADGTTALVGGPQDNAGAGAAWVFTRGISGTWKQQAKIVGSGAIDPALQGSSVALSGDGNTAVLGGSGDHGGIGAIWIFTRNGTSWTQSVKRIGTGAVGNASQGKSVAISSDGKAVVVGGPNDDSGNGAAWVFAVNGNGVWIQQGSKLVGDSAVGAAGQGGSVSISDKGATDGAIILVGGSNDNSNQGATWSFARVSGNWTQLGSKLVGSGASGNAAQGSSVAVSGDGMTALIGGLGDNGYLGAAWTFTRKGATWTQLGAKLAGTDAVTNAYQGNSVALSDNGATAIVAGMQDSLNQGAAWIYARTDDAILTDTHDFAWMKGKTDFVTINGSGTVACILVSRTNAESNLLRNCGTAPANAQLVAQRDFDGDGATDLLWRNPKSGELTLWLAGALGEWGATSLGYVSPRWTLAGAGDFDHDGVADILFRDSKTGTLAIWFMGGTRIVSRTVGFVPMSWSVIAVTADGNIFWQDTGGNVALWTMNGTDVANASTLGVAPTGFTLAANGDFDGDGYPDLLWINAAGNQARMWLTNNGSLKPQRTISTPGSTWALELTGDFDGDGKSDIMWKSTKNVNRTIWYMNGASRSDSSSFIFTNDTTAVAPSMNAE